MSIKQEQLTKLPKRAQEQLWHVLKQLHAGSVLTQSDVGLMGFNWTAAQEKDVAEIFHTTTRTLQRWVIDGCPKTPEGLYDIFQVHMWLMDREIKKTVPDGDSLKDQKTRQEIEKITKQNDKLSLEIEDIKNKTISRDLHDEVRVTMCDSFKNYLVNSLQLNIIRLRGASEEQLPALVDDFGKMCIKNMLSAGSKVENQ